MSLTIFAAIMTVFGYVGGMTVLIRMYHPLSKKWWNRTDKIINICIVVCYSALALLVIAAIAGAL